MAGHQHVFLLNRNIFRTLNIFRNVFLLNTVTAKNTGFIYHQESMKMMGLANWLHWTAWLVKYLLFLLISVIIMTILICVRFGEGSILTYSDGSLLFVFLMLYCLSIITFCFAISTFFSKGNIHSYM